ncbi:two component LuxR family transcriptional regulator [Caballeronia pedi]|uniref:Two component LuxR family transcriptional regulator n=1 Tax=Caballeronia pedi TaxID=1777141 RepID=A0A158DFB5_9BURK|nr:response regulator transcription factor [Caballeronia pedi]SAK92956.1 two component LuxR family transcriptional regulator [Caballeronia pedi]
MTNVLIADDHELVREGLHRILLNSRRFDVVGEAGDGPGTLELVRSIPAHVLVLDLSLPGRNGLDLLRQIRKERPDLRILVLTMQAEQQYAVRAFKAGAAGYLTKACAASELLAAVSKVASGGVYVSISMAEQYAQRLYEPASALPHQRLSDREFDVFRRIASGGTITEIAKDLCLSAKTVSTYKARILEKMQMPHEAALVRYAVNQKLFDEDE